MGRKKEILRSPGNSLISEFRGICGNSALTMSMATETNYQQRQIQIETTFRQKAPNLFYDQDGSHFGDECNVCYKLTSSISNRDQLSYPPCTITKNHKKSRE
jgi:hypothetical protein